VPSYATLRDCFRGALLGTAIGDALGAPFDDTHMTIGVAESLTARGGFDGAHMAGCFVSNFEAEPWRGYGPGPPMVFKAIRAGAAWHEPAAALFRGQGSFGNGAAMRVAPVGLFLLRDLPAVARTARDTARITHAHPVGQDGAAVQACAVALLAAATPTSITTRGLLDELRAIAGTGPFHDKLRDLELYAEASPQAAIEVLGNGIAAEEAVSAALFAAMHHIDSFPSAVITAIGLGGDTDTIAAMTGALAGALHGAEAIPGTWRARLESRDRLEALAGDLFTAAAGRRFGA
jgi:poly(ADP-ribose) glycohydrolase ARH3